MKAPTERFSTRVDNYVKYRPSYPAAIIELLKEKCGLGSGTVVADIGSGPGNLTRLLLPIAKHVFAVEPNREMRMAGEFLIGGYENFESVDGTAETTKLKDESVDLITASQAFHWFDQKVAKQEFLRILRPGSYVALIWNDRCTNTSPFLIEYEELLRTTPEYAIVNHSDLPEAQIAEFFAPGVVTKYSTPYQQHFDWESFHGRVMSSSYVPEDDAEFGKSLRAIYDKYQNENTVVFEYNTTVFYGQMKVS